MMGGKAISCPWDYDLFCLGALSCRENGVCCEEKATEAESLFGLLAPVLNERLGAFGVRIDPPVVRGNRVMPFWTARELANMPTEEFRSLERFLDTLTQDAEVSRP